MSHGQFRAIEGLRGYLALWVAIGHGFQLSGLFSLPGPADLFLHTGVPVEVFMILSGFVITHLLMERHESYSYYITRRFFRLYPVYVIGCAAGFLVMPVWKDIVQNVPWYYAAGWRDYSESVVEIANQTLYNTPYHLVAHSLMLHGAIPNDLLSRSAVTFLPAAWSISLEWQFYLIAPFIILAGRPILRVCILSLLVVGYIVYLEGWLGDFTEVSLIFLSFGHFLVGIVSRVFYESARKSALPMFTTVVITATASIFLLKSPISMIIWGILFVYMLQPEEESLIHRIIRFFLEGKIALFVGASSYSIYLLHRPLQVIFGYVLIEFGGANQVLMMVTQLAAIIVVIPVAAISYRYIERPGITFGRYAARFVKGYTVRA